MLILDKVERRWTLFPGISAEENPCLVSSGSLFLRTQGGDARRGENGRNLVPLELTRHLMIRTEATAYLFTRTE
jgi:hypothetical protein